MQKKMEKINYLFLMILPFIDLLTALSARYLSIPISIGVLIKGLYTIFLAVYIIFYTKTKNKKKFIYYTISLIIYSLMYILTKKHIWEFNIFIKEFVALYKYLFTGYILFAYIVLNEENKNNYSKIMFYSLLCYTALLIIPELTNTSYKSYMHKENLGSVGWFYSANEISAIVLMLFPFYYSTLKEKLNNKKYVYCFLIIPIIYSIFIIGTKTSWYGLIILCIAILIIYILKEKKSKKLIVFSIIILSTLLLLNCYSPANSNLISKLETTVKTTTINNKNTNSKNNEKKEQDTINFSECGKYYRLKNIIKNEKIYKPINLLLSGRENKAYTLLKIYESSLAQYKLLGLGFNDNSNINNCYIIKYIEIDLLDAFVHFGIIGFIIMLYPFILLIKQINFKKIKIANSQTLIYFISSVLIIGLSFLSGHILGYPTPSIYLSILLIFLLNSLKEV